MSKATNEKRQQYQNGTELHDDETTSGQIQNFGLIYWATHIDEDVRLCWSTG